MYKIGIISTSMIVDTFMEAVVLNDDCVVTSLYSQNEQAIAMVNRHGIKSLYDDYQMFLQGDIDIVYVASANVAHFEQAMLAIKAKKHVLIEKPMALKPEEIELLYQEAIVNGVFIMEAMTMMCMENMANLRDLVARIGAIKHVKFNMLQQTRHYANYTKGHYFNVFDIKKGGGCLYDLGVYLVYPCLYLFGEPKNVNYFPILNKLGADTTTSLVLNYDGFDAILSGSKVCYDPSNSVICGDGGTIEIIGISELREVILYDVKGNVIERYQGGLKPRMADELCHFIKVLDTKRYESSVYTKALALSVSKIVSAIKEEEYDVKS